MKTKQPFFHVPFMFEIMKLNKSEGYYLLIGGLASVAFGALVFGLVVSFISGWKLTLVLLSLSPLMIYCSFEDME